LTETPNARVEKIGLRFAWLALALNLLGPLGLPAVAAMGRGGETAVVCTAQGMKVVVLDADGRSKTPPGSGEDCQYCLPLLKQGAAAPAAVPAPAPLVLALRSAAPPAAVDGPGRIQSRLIAAPRAPPAG